METVETETGPDELRDYQEHAQATDAAWHQEDADAKWRDVRDFLGTDLLDMDTSQPHKWVPGAEWLLLRGVRATLVAKQGEGKTQATLHLVVQVCEANGRVILMDVENDRMQMARRLQHIINGREDPE